MRIGIVCYPSIGGSGLVATELGLNLAKRGHQVHFISYTTPFRLQHFHRNVQFHAVDPINYPLFNQPLYTFALTAKIIEVTEAFDLDLVHAHYSIPHSLCAHLAREVSPNDFRIVTTLHGTDVTIVGQDKPLFPINKYGIEQSDHVTTVSAYQKEHTRRYFGIRQEIEVIYNFIDTNVFRPRHVDRSCLADTDQPVVMHISNFRPLKNVEGVVRAFHLLRAEHSLDARLALVGEGPEIKTVRLLCRELGICRHVSFLGRVDSVEDVLPMADVVLQPSYRESFGMVLLEAMACGVPTVSSDIDGIPEVVVEGETGFMTGPDDHASLAERMTRILDDRETRRRLGEQARERVLEKFDEQHIVPRYEACYRRVLDGAPQPPRTAPDGAPVPA